MNCCTHHIASSLLAHASPILVNNGTIFSIKGEHPTLLQLLVLTLK